jgi:hypothetical protein
VFEFSLSNPSAIAVDYTLHSPMELLEVLITLPLRKSNCTCGCYYGNGVCNTTADTAESNETFIVSGTASATGTINDNDAAQL